MSGYKFALRKKDRPESLLDLAAWRQDVTDRSSSPLGKTLFEKLAKRPPLEVDPGSENDVIALFAGLIAADMLKGYQLAALSGYNQYDGLVHIITSNETVSNLNDPFSVRDQTNTSEGKYKVLEFKLHFADLFEDFDLRKKNPSDINLLVCWTLPDISVTRGRLQYTYGDRNDYRQVYGMTHLWDDENSTSSIPIICLRHFLAEKLKYEEHDQPGIGTAIYAAILEQEKTACI